MKRYTYLIVTLLLLSITSLSQDKKPDYSGVWNLDVAKSKLPEMMRIEAQTLVVTQTATDLTFKTETKRAPRPEGGMPQGGPPGGGGGGRLMIGGDAETKYMLDGKETSVEIPLPGGNVLPAVRKGEIKDGKLSLLFITKFNGPMGEVEIKSNESWELSNDGKTLKRIVITESPRGTQTTEYIFTKGEAKPTAEAANNNTASGEKPAGPKFLDTGVVNGKAVNLVKPVYPVEAKEKGIGGPVKVKVIIDEQGSVMSAQAIDGDNLLRKACEDAAKASKFNPTNLGGNPVKVRGVIIYNFTPSKIEPKKP